MQSDSKVVSGGPRPNTPGTLNQLFFDSVEKFDKPNALEYKVNGAYKPISHRELALRVRNLARGLEDLGVKRGAKAAILSENRPEWVVADLACLTAGIVDVTVYATLIPEQIQYILHNSGSVAVFVSTQVQADKIASIRNELPDLKHVISFDKIEKNVDFTIDALESKGAELTTDEWIAEYKRIALDIKPDDIATLLYTSGTTGDPKGVMLTHDNIYSNVTAAWDVVDFYPTDVALCFLPLSHIFERMAGYYLMLATGCTIAYAEAIETVAADLMQVRPTILVSNPRLFEKVYARVLETARAGGGLKYRIFLWARNVAEQWADAKLKGEAPGTALDFKYNLAQKLVFGKIKERTGGRLRYSVSGGAPLSPEINKFFYAIGLLVLEGYGLTETSPVITVNTPDKLRIGTVGHPLRGIEVKIAQDGEILTRGPHVMKGYYNNPTATAEAIDSEGWFKTGDIGELKDGFLTITDRKKDIIVTSGGKNIAPQPIEGKINQNKFVSQAVVIGDKRRFPSVLIVPEFDQLEKWARYKKIAWNSHEDLIKNPAVIDKIDREVFATVKDLAQYERPKTILIVEHEFSIERGTLTPSLKVKRRIVEEQYKEEIENMYAAAVSHDPHHSHS